MKSLTKSLSLSRSVARPSLALGRAAAPAPSAMRLARRSLLTATAAGAPKTAMFCMQCEQTEKQTGCTTIGVCGKTPEVAGLQDLLMHCVKGIGMYAHRARTLDPLAKDSEIDEFALTSLFSTMTNVNFDASRMMEELAQANTLRDRARQLYFRAAANKDVVPDNLAGTPAEFDIARILGNKEALLKAGEEVGVQARKARLDPDVLGLQEMATYGLKGSCAYADHALVLERANGGKRTADFEKIFAGVHDILNRLTNDKASLDELLETVMAVGRLNLIVMEYLDGRGTSKYGNPSPATVSTTPLPGKAILVSGHDLVDLEAILVQTQGKGINVYTHGELLPAHGYPELRKFKHLAGHYGGPWQLQKMEFAQFPGPIVMTTNCIIEPKKSYKDRLFTRSVVGWPGCTHLPNTDFSAVVASALSTPGFDAATIKPSKPLTTGFGHHAVLSVADKVVEAVKGGQIKHFFVVGGCDGTEGERSYFTDVATQAPKDSVILTLGCGKYRFNRQEFGEIGGIPRLLDLGQCNDAYSGIVIASALAKAFNTGVNDLPLSFAVSWFEQKAVAVLLTLLSLGIKRIRLGPHLPAFCTPNMLNVLVSKFDLKPIGQGGADVAAMLMKQ